ncbi:N-methyl-L-tryptophan oxidase [Microseira sp. BLCC-F43]|jgi:monomeric sarcosine oxidase|uniref:N-methyl-L-tryptophan oxidase n=1 Tax=Microseira sp. BLCC-F43 TaxID=3153602 RepID=UPI0035BAEC31
MPQIFDAIIIGAGAMGSAAAYHLSKAGQRVLLLEQFAINHQKGSSYGSSRIIRYIYNHPTYIELAKAAYPGWLALEAEAGETLYTKTGGFFFGLPENKILPEYIKCTQSANIPYEFLSAQELCDRYPQFCLSQDMLVYYQQEIGFLAASKCVLAHIHLAKQHGAIVKEDTPVVRVTVNAYDVEITTQTDSYIANKLIITAGSWAQSVLSPLGINLPLVTMRAQYSCFEPDRISAYEVGNFPIFIGFLHEFFGDIIYGFPYNHDVGVKVNFNEGQPVNHVSEVNYTPDQHIVQLLRDFNSQYLPDLDIVPKSSRVCLYTMTPDRHFIIDRHPEYPQIVFAAGFSGHGFKFGNVVGKILCDLTLEDKTEHDISLFSAFRFG